ncbi:TniQ family protein [Schinkia sp. CFF1]
MHLTTIVLSSCTKLVACFYFSCRFHNTTPFNTYIHLFLVKMGIKKKKKPGDYMLLFYPKPYTQETLLSFIYRVAKEHEMANLNWIFEVIAKELSINLAPEKINWLKGNDLKCIAEFLGIEFENAKNLTVYKYFERYQIEVRNESKNIWFLYKKTRFCPLCLKEGLYQRKSWISCHSIMCLEHNTLLMDSCENCGNIPTTMSIILDECPKCNKKLSNSLINTNVTSGFIEYQKIVDQIIENCILELSHPWIRDFATFFKTLDFLALWTVKMVPFENLSIIKNDLYFSGGILERNHLKNYRSIQQAACLYSYVFKIIKNWPVGFNDFIRIAEKQNGVSINSFIKQGIPRTINTPLWDISMAFSNYIAKEKYNLTGEQFIRSDEVKFLYPKFNGGIINSNHFNHYKLNYKNTIHTLIDNAKLENFAKNFIDSYNKEEFRDIWGTSAKSTLSILYDGLIEDAFYFKSGSVINWIIPKSSVSKLEKKVKKASMSTIINPITFNHAVEWIGPEKAHILLKKILNEEIRFKYKTNKLSNLLLNKSDIYYEIKSEIIKKSIESNFISIRDLTFILGVKKSDIHYWIINGRFGNIKEYDSNIPIHNFLHFHEKFMTTYEVAFKLNLHTKQVLKKHTMGKLISFSGPQVKDGKRLLFCRGEFDLN